MPMVFSPIDPHMLYFASNVVWKTTDGGQSWTAISPDLTRADMGACRRTSANTAAREAARPTQRGVVYTLAPSPLDGDRDLGRHRRRPDPRHARRRARPGRTSRRRRSTPWAKVSMHRASHFDANTAYAAVNTLRLDDLRPHIYRTHDGGKTWTRDRAAASPTARIVNAVREDPQTQGLLFAGTEQRGVRRRSTTATSGSRCGSTCRRRRSAIW